VFLDPNAAAADRAYTMQSEKRALTEDCTRYLHVTSDITGTELIPIAHINLPLVRNCMGGG
jgi:hypothetical protein